jgi:hypothetical protein
LFHGSWCEPAMVIPMAVARAIGLVGKPQDVHG